MKILIIGASGMLGHKLTEKLSKEFFVCATVRNNAAVHEKLKILPESQTFDNANAEDELRICEIIVEVKPDVIINAAGIIKQLSASEDIVQTLTVNSIFPHRLAALSEKYNARFITFSTDCVFSGRKGNYAEEDAPDAPDLYGRSKNFGEIREGNSLTLRTSIIGRELFTKHSLVEWFLSNRGKKVKGFKKAVFSGLTTNATANVIADVIKNHKELRGLYHLSAEPINKYDLLGLLKKEYKVDVEIEEDENFVIDRSLNSARFRAATGFVPQSWTEMIAEMAQDNALYEK